MIVAFDIGGVISRYPEKMKEMMQALIQGGIDVRVVTDIPFEKAWRLLCLNGFDFLSKGQLHSGDWAIHGDMCKSVICERFGIDVLIDDRPDYCAVGDFIGMVLSPRPDKKPYYSENWVNS